MDESDDLHVRFHYSGAFFFDGNNMEYLDGSARLSDIDRDLISLPEITGHLRDHGIVSDDILLHWLFPSKTLDNGLTVLHDDKMCQLMEDCVIGSEVAYVYVGSMDMQIEALADDEGSDAAANNIRDTIIEVGDGSFDEVQFIVGKERYCYT